MTAVDDFPMDASRPLRLGVARAAVGGALMRPESLAPFLIARMSEARVSSAAAALSFWTALAVVPALALVLATLAAFPAFDQLRASLQEAIVSNLVPDTGLRISEALTNFIEAAANLTAFGVVGLVLTSVLLLLTIEDALNEIFGVTRQRPLRKRLLVFWAVMTIGPVLLGAGLSLLGYFASIQMFEGAPAAGPTAILLGSVMPTLLTWATLAFLFIVVPNRRMSLKDVLIGAAVAALLLAALRYAFALYVVLMTSYQAIYGALAAVPVFLVWIYLVWFAVMVGAVITAALPEWRTARVGFGPGVGGRLVLALEVLARLAVARRGGVGLAGEPLAKTLGASGPALNRVLDELRVGMFITPTEDGYWVLSRDLERTALADLVHHFGLGLNMDAASDEPKLGDLGKRLNQYLQNAAESERTLLSVSLARLVMLPEESPPAAN